MFVAIVSERRQLSLQILSLPENKTIKILSSNGPSTRLPISRSMKGGLVGEQGILLISSTCVWRIAHPGATLDDGGRSGARKCGRRGRRRRARVWPSRFGHAARGEVHAPPVREDILDHGTILDAPHELRQI